jgi:beta-lactamase class A
LVGGPKKVEAYIHSLGVNEVAIVNTEKEMHTSWDLQFKNWTSPAAMVELLDLFYRKKILSPSSRHVLMEIMEQTITGSRRIKGLLPKGTIVAHKTGMGGNDEGVIAAINDVGIITLPTGKHVAIAFFISNTREPIDPLEDVMAKISKIVFDYYSKQ